MKRRLLMMTGFALLAAPIGLGLFAEAVHVRSMELLERINATESKVSYQGRRAITLRDTDGLSTTLVDFHVLRPGGSRMTPVLHKAPDGKESVIGGDAKLPRPFRWMGFLKGALDGSRDVGRFRSPALILENYRLVRKGSDVIAGRTADRFELKARHANRSSYEFATDRATDFLLAFRVVAVDGTLAYESRFESIRFDPPPLPETAKTEGHRPKTWSHGVDRTRVTEADLRGLMTFTTWRPRWLPVGYKLRQLDTYRIKDLGESVLAIYSDGMTSLFIAQVSSTNKAWQFFRGAYLGMSELPRESQPGEVSAHRITHPGGALLDLTLDGTEIVLGGQIESMELEKIAQNLVKIE